MPTDTELLQDFIRQKSDQAFARIVARYSNLVYAAALRQVRDPGMAEDVTQSAFLVLARKAASVPEKRLAGWLLTTTRLCALDALKKQSRRTHYEREAAMAKSEISQSVEPHDPSVTVLLDEAMTRLRSRDCTALALRYLEDKPINDVAAAIGVTPHAAQKIVSRSLAKLRAILARKGVILSSTDVLALALLHQTAHTAPVGMVISLSSSKAASFSIAKGVTDMMFWTKVKLAAVIVATVVVAGGAGSIVAVRALAQTPVPTPNPPPSVKVVTIIPNDGAIDVDPATKQLRVTFNQPMDTRGYSFVEDGSDTYPGTAALPYWLDDTTCVLPIALKPDHDYWLSLNSDRFQNFRTVQGQPLPPDPIEFHTVAAVPATSPALSASAASAAPFHSPFLELVGCRIRQTLSLTLSPGVTTPASADWVAQQYSEVRWAIDPGSATKITRFAITVTSASDPTSAQTDQVAKSDTTYPLVDQLSQPGEYDVRVDAVGPDSLVFASAAAHIVVHPLPPANTIVVADVLADGSIRAVAIGQNLNSSSQPIDGGTFMDYEFVQIEKIADDSGRSLPFTSRLQNNPIPSHDPDRDPTQGNSNLYSYKLIDPIQPGDPLLLSITAKINHLIKKDPTGLFQYALNVNPNNNDPVHRIELIRLPAGAVLVSTSDKFATRVIDGRIQLYQDYTIPSGGSQLSTFSYRLPQ